MNHFCSAVHCHNPAAYVINGDYVCTGCAKHEITVDYAGTKAALIAEYTQSQVVTDAIEWINHVRTGMSVPVRVYEDTAHACLGRVCVMLALYGSMPEAILNVIHQRGHESVTLADVKAVREFVLKGE